MSEEQPGLEMDALADAGREAPPPENMTPLGLLRHVLRRRPAGTRRPRRFRAFTIGVVIVLLSITTCSAGVTIEALTADYGRPLPATTDAAKRFLERAVASAQRASSNRRFSVTVSEQEATSVFALGLLLPELLEVANRLPPESLRQARTIDELRDILQAGRDSVIETSGFAGRVADWFNPELRTSEAQVRFTHDGHIVMATNVHAWAWRLPMLFVVRPRARPGEVEFDFVRGRVGRVPAPEWAFDLTGRLVASLLMQGRRFGEISHLSVEDGQLTFEATRTQ